LNLRYAVERECVKGWKEIVVELREVSGPKSHELPHLWRWISPRLDKHIPDNLARFADSGHDLNHRTSVFWRTLIETLSNLGHRPLTERKEFNS
jgi:hypothetical protein